MAYCSLSLLTLFVQQRFLPGLQNLRRSPATLAENSAVLLTLGAAGEDIRLGLVTPASVELA